MITCPLCGYHFDDRGACQGCGLVSHCVLLKCPRCYYEFVETSKTVSFLQKLWRRLKKTREVNHEHPSKVR